MYPPPTPTSNQFHLHAPACPVSTGVGRWTGRQVGTSTSSDHLSVCSGSTGVGG